MYNTLAKLHRDTYNSLAEEYEGRVETCRAVTEHALSPFINYLPEQAKILDIGCAVGYTVEILKQHGKDPEGIDISPAMIAYARKRNPDTELVVGDFLDQPYPEEKFDGVLLYAFIHLFPKEVATQCFAKVVTVMKTGGYLFAGTTKSTESSEGFEQKTDYASSQRRFRKRWTQPELEDLFQIFNLKVVHYEDNTDEFGKVWMDYVVRKGSRP